jgi:hypothetical protein
LNFRKQGIQRLATNNPELVFAPRLACGSVFKLCDYRSPMSSLPPISNPKYGVGSLTGRAWA